MRPADRKTTAPATKMTDMLTLLIGGYLADQVALAALIRFPQMLKTAAQKRNHDEKRFMPCVDRQEKE
jgi:hypothetical protein